MSGQLIQDIYRAFDPGPLQADETDLYIDLDDVRGSTGVVQKLVRRILLSDKPTCQVLAGHRGSGKSTELRRLQHKLETGDVPVFVVYCEADEDIDRNDVDFPEVLIAIVRQMAAQLKDRLSIALKPGYFKDRWDRLKNLMTSDVNLDNVGLDVGMMQLSATVRGSPDARLKIRELLEPDTSNWLYATNDLIGEARIKLREHGYMDLVIVVDDLDKMVLRSRPDADCSTGEYLFVHREAQLTAFAAHMVYTMPIALAYSSSEQVIANLYGGHVPVVPMTKVATRPPKSEPYEPGIRKMRDLLAARLRKAGAEDHEVYRNARVRNDLIRASGGQPRELLLLVREAIVTGGLPVSSTAVKRALAEGKRAYARQLRADHWPCIESVRRTGTLARSNENEQVIRDLLDSRAILQYANQEEWYGVNPLVSDLRAPGAHRRKK